MSGSLLIRAARVVGVERREPVDIGIARGRIFALESSAAGRPKRAADEELDAEGLLVAPGYIDLQINGAAGHDLTADPTAIWAVGEALPRYGVTAFLPTIVTSPREVVEAARRTLLGGPPPGYAGARPLGLHIEGPFIAVERIGAHDPGHRRDPDPAFLAGWSREAGVGMVTLAPELPGALELIGELARRRIVASIGHTAATSAQARAAFDAGARFVTHLFNAMPGLDRRDPGPVGAALADGRVTVGLIPDGLHVDPSVVGVAWRAAGAARFAAVTDAIAALGMAPGAYRLGTMDVVVDVASARLPNGRLAGSIISLDAAVRNVRAFTGATGAEAVGTVTATPARLLGLAPARGVVREGGAADLTVLSPELEVVATVVGGRIVYRAEPG
ncbi:MAG: N-acetylglucosamine-6-phosphate deacetylase [Chloroflexota bacterium]